MISSTYIKTQVVVVIILTQISLYVRVDKENLLEFPLIGLAIYTQICIYKYLSNYFILHISFES